MHGSVGSANVGLSPGGTGALPPPCRRRAGMGMSDRRPPPGASPRPAGRLALLAVATCALAASPASVAKDLPVGPASAAAPLGASGGPAVACTPGPAGRCGDVHPQPTGDGELTLADLLLVADAVGERSRPLPEDIRIAADVHPGRLDSGAWIPEGDCSVTPADLAVLVDAYLGRHVIAGTDCPGYDCSSLAGRWDVTETVDAVGCGDGSFTWTWRVHVSQEGCSIAVTDEEGNAFSGTVTGNRAAWSGSFPELGGRTVITDLSATISGAALSGSTSWDWSDGERRCSGSSEFTARRP